MVPVLYDRCSQNCSRWGSSCLTWSLGGEWLWRGILRRWTVSDWLILSLMRLVTLCSMGPCWASRSSMWKPTSRFMWNWRNSVSFRVSHRLYFNLVVTKNVNISDTNVTRVLLLDACRKCEIIGQNSPTWCHSIKYGLNHSEHKGLDPDWGSESLNTLLV